MSRLSEGTGRFVPESQRILRKRMREGARERERKRTGRGRERKKDPIL